MVIVFALMRGGHGAPSIIGIASCSGVYWLLLALAFAFAVVVTAFFARKNLKLWDLKAELNYRFSEGDVHWTTRNTIVHPCMCFLAGVAAGLLGIGGGLVLGPLFLEMGMLPEVSTSTSSFMVLFTSSTTTLQFLILGQLKLDYAGFLLPACFVGALAGVLIVKRMIKKYGRMSIVVFALATVIGASGIMIPAFGVYNLVKDIDEGQAPFVFTDFCKCA